jgi:hypothetical protein
MAAFSGTGPTLPRELEKIIFEMAALKHPLSMPSMVRVAQRVKIWYILSFAFSFSSSFAFEVSHLTDDQ